MTTDNARAVLSDPRAPADERFDAQAEMEKKHTPTITSDLIPGDLLRPIIDYFAEQGDSNTMTKALRSNVVPFPSKRAEEKKKGMQSVYLDDFQISVVGDYYDKPSALSFEAMRQMMDTPILASVLLTRQRQMARFCRPQENGKGPGFEIRMRDKDAHATDTEKESMKALTGFFTNCGWESNPRARAKMKRDSFSGFMAKCVRDTLTLDSMPIETEFKKDRKLGMDGFYAVDGATIRLCSEVGYKGDDDIYALQVVSGQLRTAFTFDDLIYVPRNPRTDVAIGGYGMSETELLIKVITGYLNAFTFNNKYFDSNAIPKGMLNIYGNYADEDIKAFKKYWRSMVEGVNNAWSLPVMVSKDQESAAKFEKFGVDVDEMMFSKWMTFLASMICAIYGISPEEINFESFSTKGNGLSGDDTEEKLVNSKDKGLRPLQSYFEDLFSDYIVADFSDKYCFRFTGLDEEDEKTKFERQKLSWTVNELRALDGKDEIKLVWGEAPLNPSLVGVYQAEAQAPQEDFGQPPGEAGPDDGSGADAGMGNDFGDQGDDKPDFGDPVAGDGSPQPGQAPKQAAGQPDGEDFGKSFGLPIFKVGE